MTVAPDDRLSRAAFLRRVVRRHVPTDRAARILDLGCGDGTFLHFLREAGYGNVRGVEVSAERIASACARGLVGIEHCDARIFMSHFPTGEADTVVTWDLIEHLPKEDLGRLAANIFRALAPGGRWILHVPNAESPFGARVLFADPTHVQAFTRESVGGLARAAGFTRVTCFEDTPAVTGPFGLARRAVWAFLRTGLRVWVAAETGETGPGPIFSQNLTAVATKS